MIGKLCGGTKPFYAHYWAGPDPPPYKNPCEGCGVVNDQMYQRPIPYLDNEPLETVDKLSLMADCLRYQQVKEGKQRRRLDVMSTKLNESIHARKGYVNSGVNLNTYPMAEEKGGRGSLSRPKWDKHYR